jgi:hypothetical protein
MFIFLSLKPFLLSEIDQIFEPITLSDNEDELNIFEPNIPRNFVHIDQNFMKMDT